MPPKDAGTKNPSAPGTPTKRGLLLIISGPSGAGKTTITRAVERAFPNALFSVSATTRPRTGADRDGVDYHFISPPEFDSRIAAGEFIETALYAGNRYGTLRAPVDAALAEGRLVILEIDVQGAIVVKAKMPEAFALFILPPSDQALLQRLRDRKREPEEAIQRRYRLAQQEMATARTCGVYDVFIVNDDLDRAIAQAMDAVNAHLARAPT
jgi:guanylate kinase